MDTIQLLSDKLRYVGVTVNNPLHISVEPGVTVVMGPNGSGKSTFGRIIEKGWNIMTNSISAGGEKPVIKFIEFSDIHSLSGCHVEYYQQRHEATMNDEVPTVAEIMGENVNSDRWRNLCSRLRLEGVESKKVNYLSSGELRKLLIINMMFQHPDMLIIDNPYIGLDAVSRGLLDEALAEISTGGTSIMLLLCNPGEIPDCTDQVIPMKNLTLGEPVECRGNAAALRESMMTLMDYAVDLERVPKSPKEKTAHEVTVELHGCNVSYGDRKIIENESWLIKQGECWALAGPNGSGKSVLLSLIYADNPQAYSNDITLFDRRRGSGESIWDIKRRIGYVSPEMHLYFRFEGVVRDVVAQGLRSTTGNYGLISRAAAEEAMAWLSLFHLEHLAEMRYSTLSTGEQRLVLIARTLIKHPDLLILDEPLHGLDAARKRSVRAVINTIVRRDAPTLIYVTHFLPEVPECVTKTKTLKKLKNA